MSAGPDHPRVLLPPPLLYVGAFAADGVIRREERYLESKFGEPHPALSRGGAPLSLRRA